MVRRILLSIVLVVVGLALVNGAAVQQAPDGWLPGPLYVVQRYVGAEGAVAGGIFGMGLLVAATSPLRYRIWVVLAVLDCALTVAAQANQYFRGRGDVLPPIVFWIAGMALLLALFPTRGRAQTSVGVPPLSVPTAGQPPGTPR